MNQLPQEYWNYIEQKKEEKPKPVANISIKSQMYERNILLQKDVSQYKSPSEARMSRLIYLVSLGLSDDEIEKEMNKSIGLHWQEKKHLHANEIIKARQYVSKNRRQICRI